MFDGYHIPSQLLFEAREHRGGLADWQKLPIDKQKVHFHTQRLIMDQFPDLPILSSKIITERLVRASYRHRISKTDLENEVVEHARHCWTSYASLLEQRRREGKIGFWDEDDVDLIVRPRLRAVLERWLGKEVNPEYKQLLFNRQKLVDISQQSVYTKTTEKIVGGNLMWYGGKETVANMRAGFVEPGERSVRIFL